jgi:hypothetical protein
MSIKNLFQSLWKNESEMELKMKVKLLESNLNSLKNDLKDFQEKANLQKDEQIIKEPPIIIEKINIEKIILDKYELNNNFGQLGIKELKGKLNIGATYGSEFTPNLENENNGEDEKSEYENKRKQKGNGPVVNIKTKKDH